MEKSVAFSGYRDKKFSFMLDDSDNCFLELKKRINETIINLIEDGYLTFYIGGCDGFDILVGETLLLVKQLYPQIKIIVTMPFLSFGNDFEDRWKNSLKNLLDFANEIIYISNEYYRGIFQKRNIYMVDNSNILVAYHDGKKGGTYNTINYAKKSKKKVINIFEDQLSLFY